MNSAGTPDDDPQAITTDVIANAERLLGLSFTDDERALLPAAATQQVARYAALQAFPLGNSAPPAFTFDPRPLGQRAAGSITRRYSVSPQPDIARPDKLEDLAFYSVAQLGRLLQTRQVTSVELTELYLARLERYGATLECVVTLTPDLAMRQARRADADFAQRVVRSPLQGIPWGAKDLLAVRGYRTTWGAAPYREQILDFDATVVQRLEQAGAVLVAKLSLGELASGDRWFGGSTHNPWDIREPSGGSSAGPAAAVSAGLVGFAIGSETGGSIVWPSGRCGITGLRPTFGLVPKSGAMALSWTMDKLGPMARTAEDCALVLTAIYGPDGLDPFAIDAPLQWTPDADVRGLRIGYVPQAFEAPDYDSADYADTVKTLRKHGIELRDDQANNDATLEALRQLDVALVPLALPDFPLDAMRFILNVEAAAAFDDLTRHSTDDLLVWQGEDAYANKFRLSRFVPAVEYLQASRVRALLVEAMADCMRDVDALVLPQLYGNNMLLANLTGQPGVALPNGFDRGMPTAIHLIGKPFEDAKLLTIAYALQQATRHHLRRPPLDWAH